MSESNHHPSGPLTVAVALAAAAGFADAHIYVNVTPIFVANMSGNLIHLGILVGDASWRAAVASLLTLAAFTAGAYGFTMASNYNARGRTPEILADGDSYTVIRKRETYEDLVALER